MKKILALIIAFGIVSSASATVVYDNGAPVSDSNWCSEDSGQCGGTWTVFDDFTLASATTIDSVNWSTHLWSGLADYNGASLWVYDADPVFDGGNLLFTMTDATTATVNLGLGVDIFDITMSGLGLSLAAGNYWMGFRHDTTADYATMIASALTGNATQWQNDGAGFRQNISVEMAFTIESGATAVPEPSTLALLGLGMIGLVVARRRAR